MFAQEYLRSLAPPPPRRRLPADRRTHLAQHHLGPLALSADAASSEVPSPYGYGTALFSRGAYGS